MGNESDLLQLPFTGLVSFLRAPHCRDLDRLDADIAILGVPSDEGSPWLPGARLAPRVIREMSVRGMNWGTSARDSRYGYYDLQEDKMFLEDQFRSKRITDCGDVDIIFTNVEHTFRNISAAVSQILKARAMPTIIGGDHAITFPVVRAFEKEFNPRGLNIIHFDAHLDYWPFQHGVAYSNGTCMRLIGDLPHIDHMVQIGIRSLRHRRDDYLDSLARGNDVVTVKKARQHGIESALQNLATDKPVYVSIDIDVLDMPLVPGCSSSEVGGFDYLELRDYLSYIGSAYNVVGVDLVEVNPLIDIPSKNTSLIAAQLLQEFLGRIVENDNWKARRIQQSASR